MGCWRTFVSMLGSYPVSATQGLPLISVADARQRLQTGTGTLLDLDQALNQTSQAADKLRAHGELYARICWSWALGFKDKFAHAGDLNNLDRGMELQSQVLALHPEGHPDRSSSLNNLAASFTTRFNHRGDLSDLHQSIDLQSKALALCAEGHPDRLLSLNNLSVALKSRYNQQGDSADLDITINLQREATALCPDDHSAHPSSLRNIGMILNT